LRDFELDLLTFFQGLEAVHVDCGEVCEQILTAIIRSDEAKTFGVIEPLNGTCCHKKNFQLNTNHTSHKSKKLPAPSSTTHFLPTHALLHLVDMALLAEQFLMSSAFREQ
jgi:hypothetical protein